MPSNPKPQDPTGPANERVYRSLRSQVMHGEVLPGQSMTLRGIGEYFGVSMTPAREAARRLVAEGALTLTASGRLLTPELNSDRIEELAAIRALLEPELAARAMPRAHIALLERLRNINATVSEAIVKHDATGYVRTNLEFHRTLYLRAQAPAMLAMAENIWLQLGPTMRGMYARSNQQVPMPNHQKIIAALHASDEPALRQAIHKDVTQGLRMLAA